MAVSTDFLQTWSGTCWWTGLLLNTKYQTPNLVSAHKEHQATPNPSLFCDTFSLLQKRKKWWCSLLFWTSLLPSTVFQERNFGETCKKLRLHNNWEISSKPCTQDASTFLLMVTKLPRRLRPTKAWNRARCPLSPLLYSLYTNDIDRFLTVQRGAATALDSVQVPHCDYADDIALTSNTCPQLCTAECLQFQLNKFHNYTRFKGLKLNTDKIKIMVFFSKDTLQFPPSRTMAHL